MPAEQPSAKLTAAFEEVVSFDMADRPREIGVPTLVVCGRQDPLVPPEHCAAIHQGIPDAELLMLEQSAQGHPVDADVDRFQARVLRFLAGIADRTAYEAVS
jgi:pimeloyl-ACP methyl ester carboxylesterase